MKNNESSARRAIVSRKSIIEASSKTMFMWVAAASVLTVAIAVVLIYINKQFQFNNEIISYESKAEKTLKDNLGTYDELKKNIDALAANSALASVRSSSFSDNLQVIADALAATSDEAMFAASLQSVIGPKSGVGIESIGLPEASDQVAVDPEAAPSDQSGSDNGAVELAYKVEAIGSYEAIKSFLADLERTIRPVSVTSIELSGNDSLMRANIVLKTYYQPVKNFNISKKEISKQ